MSGSQPWGPNVHSLRGRRKPRWWDKCQQDKSGNPIPNLANACIVLEEDPDFAGKFTFDEMARCSLFSGRKVEDAELIVIHRAIQTLGVRRVSLETVHEAVRGVSYRSPVHPLRERLEGLEWDGTLRLTDWLHTYLGAEKNDYHAAVGPMFVTAMVARIFEPGCQANYMLVLEGPQGILKSQACRALAGPYFSDHLPPLSSDEVRLSAHLRGKWLIEVPELSAFSRADASALKSFITRQEEIFIPKYAHVEVRELRQCVFIGTTNDDQYLKDDTGGRRFWPVRCGVISLDNLRRDRDQLFAEAVWAYHQDAKWWPDAAFEARFIKPVQDQRLWVDAWANPVRAWLDRQVANHTNGAAPGKLMLPLAAVAEGALGLNVSRFNQAEQRRLSAVVRGLGWTLRHTNKGNQWEQP